MNPSNLISRSKHLWSNLVGLTKLVSLRRDGISYRFYHKSDDGCRKAVVDIPPDMDPVCPEKCERRKDKEGILHRIKLKVIEGGTNFGTPFRRLQCKKSVSKEVKVVEPAALPEEPKRKALPMPETRAGVQVSVLGADTPIGQYVALLLKQCPCIKKLRLYEAKACQYCECNRDMCQVVHDLQHIDTNCRVQAFGCSCSELERCLQNTDIVLMLESGYLNVDMPFEKRFCYQAPIVKQYADCISTECPKAFVIVCASPIDCMVPLVAQTLKETGWYDPRRLLGSLAVPEMRASTLAARALSLEPRYTRVPCVGGTEGETLVPLFSKAVEYFDFAEHNAMLMIDAVRHAPTAVTRSDGPYLRAGDLSEAHAIAGLVNKVSQALLCQDIPRVTGFVETDLGQVISPARFIANTVELGGQGIKKYLGLERMTSAETFLVDTAITSLHARLCMVLDWHDNYLANEVHLNHNGICKMYDLPPRMNEAETELVETALSVIAYNVELAQSWHRALLENEFGRCDMQMQRNFNTPKHYHRLDECAIHLT